MIRMTTALSLTLLMAAPAMAQVVVDYGDGRSLDLPDPARWSHIAEQIGGDIEVLGEARGAFVEAGGDDVAYLVSNGAPVAADPFPELNQRIVVFEGDQQVADLALTDGAFSHPVGAVDLDGDGLDEIILEGSFYNMGTLALGLSAIQLGEVAETVQTLPDVYIDTCDASVGEQAITSSVVSVSDGQLVAQSETLDCPAN